MQLNSRSSVAALFERLRRPTRNVVIFFYLISQFCTTLQADSYGNKQVNKAEHANRYFFYRASRGDAIFYLFGSMNLGTPDDPELPEQLYTAAKSSRIVFFQSEVRREKARAYDRRLYTLPDNLSIEKLLTQDDLKLLRRTIATFGIESHSIESFAPWYLQFMLEYRLAFNMGMILEYGVEYRILRYIHQHTTETARPRVVNLLLVDELLHNMHNLPMNVQLHRLTKFLRYPGVANGKYLNDMIRYWSLGDDDRVKLTFNLGPPLSTELEDEYNTALLYSMDTKMGQRIEVLTRYPGQYLVIVGALHLIGDKSILSYLKRAGFTIERL